MSSVVDDEERYEFVAIGPGKLPVPSVAIARKDDDPTGTLYVGIEGEIALPVLEAMIAYAREGFGVDLSEAGHHPLGDRTC
ncbi:hypothetical protein ACFXGA_20110 [Actinosynnema sp. NPDC059335]|uniref:hypothetical protein n=1 Tax=Actinosynnema sp. NPDC059335 TaxID=3346804 RepID=UPI00366B1350